MAPGLPAPAAAVGSDCTLACGVHSGGGGGGGGGGGSPRTTRVAPGRVTRVGVTHIGSVCTSARVGSYQVQTEKSPARWGYQEP